MVFIVGNGRESRTQGEVERVTRGLKKVEIGCLRRGDGLFPGEERRTASVVCLAYCCPVCLPISELLIIQNVRGFSCTGVAF